MGQESIRTIVGICLLSTVLPLAIFIGRNNIRNIRKGIVDDVANLFAFAKGPDGQPLIIPSLELVKYKYDPQRDEATPFRHWIIPVVLFVGLSILSMLFCFLGDHTGHNFTSFFFTAGVADFSGKENTLAGGITYTFLGGYIWSIQYLVKRISNFDLSPLSFLRCSVHLLLGIFVYAAIWHTFAACASSNYFPGGGTVSASCKEMNVSTLAGVAFLIGLFPKLGLDTLGSRFSFLQLRRVSKGTRALCEEVPLDTVLGIDPFIKFRLGEFEIEDAQNLATINPIQLFVETPYGFYEVIDWVAQAQLIVAVGAEKAKRLRNLGFRTIFDLEKAIPNEGLRKSLFGILFDSPDHPSRIEYVSGISAEAIKEYYGFDRARWGSGIVLRTDDILYSLIDIIRDDLHVKRLRQIWDVLANRLDDRPLIHHIT